jgi:hypothetical protein
MARLYCAAVGYDESATGNTEISEWALQEAIARSIVEAHVRNWS